MYLPHHTKPPLFDIEGLKAERVQDNLIDPELNFGWSSFAPPLGIRKTTTYPTFADAIAFVTEVHQHAERLEHELDINLMRTPHGDVEVHLYIGRPIAVGLEAADLDLARAIDNDA